MHVKIQLPKLFPWQNEFARTEKRNRLAVCSRQSGKTTVSKTIAVRELLAGRDTIWVAPTYGQLTENFQDIKNTVHQLISRISSPRQIELVTKGKIFFRSSDNPDSIRGLTADNVIIDEAAWAGEESYAIVRPMLATRQGRFVGISTPNGFNWFHAMYVKALKSADWFVAKYDWHCSPLLTEEEMERNRQELTPGEFRQEFEADFVSPANALFDAEWFNPPERILVDAMPTSWTRCVIGTDYSLGGSANSDFQAICTAMWSGNCLYCDFTADRLSVEAFNRRIKQAYDKYRPEGIAVETNFLQHLGAHNLLKLWAPNPPPHIWEVSNKVKKEVRISRLATLLARNQVKVLNNIGGIEAYHEFSDFGTGENHDDLLDACEMAYRVMCS